MLKFNEKSFFSIFIIIILVLLGAEIYLHLAGFGSFPIYDLDTPAGYIPTANQKGAFLNENHWAINNRHMGNVTDWTPDMHPNVLLIGNSVLYGGLPVDQPDKVAPLLEKALGGSIAVWSSAAGGWTNVNEMDFFEHNADIVANSDFVIIEFMAGGLSQATPWPGYYVFPDHKPLLLSFYNFEKYVARPFLKGEKPVNNMGALPSLGAIDPAQLQRFKNFVSNAAKTSKVIIFFYPSKTNLTDGKIWDDAIEPIVALCKSLSLACVDFSKEKDWSPELYREDKVHPTIDGNKIIAKILAKEILATSARN